LNWNAIVPGVYPPWIGCSWLWELARTWSPQGSTKAFFTHAGNSSTSENWETPKALLESLYSVFGAFDLDPCSPTSNKHTAPVKAKVHFTQDDDGLSLPWFGHVFCNPPYGKALGHWVAKAYEESRCGNTQTIVMLIPARTDTKFWHQCIVGKATIFFLKGRLKFGNVDQVAPFPSCLVVWGGSDDLLTNLQTIRYCWRTYFYATGLRLLLWIPHVPGPSMTAYARHICGTLGFANSIPSYLQHGCRSEGLVVGFARGNNLPNSH